MHYPIIALMRPEPERPKVVKDVIKQARRAAAKKSGPGGPLDF